MAGHDARIARLERAVGAMAEGPKAMLTLDLTAELRAAILEAESAPGAPLSSLTKEAMAGALWEANGNREPGVTGFPRSAWGRLATAMVLAESLGRRLPA